VAPTTPPPPPAAAALRQGAEVQVLAAPSSGRQQHLSPAGHTGSEGADRSTFALPGPTDNDSMDHSGQS
jgi:hypothetical protein